MTNDRETIWQRQRDLQLAGMTEGRALTTAIFEWQITRWPSDWGNELHFVIYGDFQEPGRDIEFPELGIVVEAGAINESPIRGALCVLRARVKVSEKSTAGVSDAAARINALLGIMSAVEWGRTGCGWWCGLTHPGLAGVNPVINEEAIEKVFTVLSQLDPRVKRKISSALYWIREPRQMLREGYRSDVLKVYAGLWNAFECLVDAVSIVRPQSKLTRDEKQRGIDPGRLHRNSCTD